MEFTYFSHTPGLMKGYVKSFSLRNFSGASQQNYIFLKTTTRTTNVKVVCLSYNDE